MSLFRSTIRPSAAPSDAVIDRYLAALRADLAPDPLFRTRLRGRIVNGYVAARERPATRRSPVREMTRIGRAVLYASFVLGVSVTGAMAASQQAIPGDVFYGLKLDMEALRYRVAPAHLHDELAAHALADRMLELDRLVDAGSPAAVALQTRAVEAAYDRVVALGGDSAAVEDQLALVAAIVDQLPDEVRLEVEAVRPADTVTPASGKDDAAAHSATGDERGEMSSSGRGETGRPADGAPGAPAGHGSAASGAAPAHSAPSPDAGAESEVTPSATPTPTPTASDTPNPTPRAADPPRAAPPRPTPAPHPHATP